MTEHIYLSRRNAEIRRLRFVEGKKLEQIVIIVQREFPRQAVKKARVSKILSAAASREGLENT